MQINIKYENLSDGEYYVKLDNGEIETALYCNGTTRSGFLYLGDRYVVEVLSPVPPYIEWQTLIDSYRSSIITVGALNADNDKLRKENQQLKDLLNYIRDEIADMPVYAKQQGFGWISEAAYRIDKAIGENNGN